MTVREAASLSPIARDVWTGLRRSPKSLPPKLLYDEVGSALFDRITRLPEYYLTRTENEILIYHAGEICAAALCAPLRSFEWVRAQTGLTLVELGAGLAGKTTTILAALLRQQEHVDYYPVDLCAAPLRQAQARLMQQFPRLKVEPVIADYTAGLPQFGQISRRKLVLYIGSSIGNFEPMEASALLARIRQSLAPGDALLLGTDMAKDETILVPAYDDSQGVTAAFNKNMLARINRELGGHFDLERFRHVALWNPQCSRMEMYLESIVSQRVPVDRLSLCVEFAAGERIHTENSYKFTPHMAYAVLQNGGFELERTWTDERGWFALHLARVTG